MTEGYHHRGACRLCESERLVCVLKLPSTPPANAFVPAERLEQPQACFPLNVWMCETCAHVQLRDVVDPGILFRDYVYVSGTSPSFVSHFQDYAADCVARFSPPRGALTVDIGSNDGTLLQFFKAAGLEILGIDPARTIAASASARGIETWPEFFDHSLVARILTEKGPANVVTANNVFAHVDDLAGFTDCVHKLLNQDGVFIFEVSYGGDVHQNALFDTIYHEHLAYHTVKPLVSFFDSHDMELFAVRRLPTHGGSIRGMVQRRGGPHAADGSVAALVAEETSRRLDCAATWTALGARIDRLGGELSSLLGELKRKGKRIAGFGAPAKATTLMYRFGLARDVIDYIVDDSPLKQGLFTPGRHIPVVPWHETETSWPDYLVILAWNFAEVIIANHRRYLDKGGHFIVPLPELRIA